MHQRLLSFLLAFLACLLMPLGIAGQTGSWRHHLAYSDVEQIERAGDDLFVMASGALYSYRPDDQSITTFNSLNGLSDTSVRLIKWCGEAGRLVVVYDDSNVDLVDEAGNVTNVSGIYLATLTGDKTVNRVVIHGSEAYLCCGFGIVRMDVKAGEIKESYILNKSTANVVVKDGFLYAWVPSEGFFRGALDRNLINPTNWENVSSYPPEITSLDRGDYDQYIETVRTLAPGGPKYNDFNRLKFQNGMLYAVGGGWMDGGQYYRKASMQMMDREGNWTCLDAPMKQDATSFAIDPDDPAHLFVATCGHGLFEYRNGEFVKQYSLENSPLESAVPGNPDYVRVDGLAYDAQKRLWMTCSEVKRPVWRMDKDGRFEAVSDALFAYSGTSLEILRQSFVDSTGKIWMVNSHHRHPCLLRIDPETDEVVRYDALRNQNGVTFSEIYGFSCVAEDAQGNIWMGTSNGPLMLNAQQQRDADEGFTQVIIPRNDGTNYGDYLLEGIQVTALVVDAANRKWIGTQGDGVFVLSADNEHQVFHFTKDNSGLLSDNIESIAIDGASGEVFIGTDVGLCSYLSDVTDSNEEMDPSEVYAYPNPVTPDYSGLVTVRGLTVDADVRVLNAAGHVVFQGRSNGGSFTWNVCDREGRRVASGVYFVVTATSEGKKGVVCKVAVIR